MKVLCIDDKERPDVTCAHLPSIIKEGVEYNVIWEGLGYDDKACTINPTPVYELAEDTGYGYPTWRFIPLSTIDETEFERSYNKELA